MEVYIYSIIIIGVILTGIFLFRNKVKNSLSKNNGLQIIDKDEITIAHESKDELQIRFEMLPATHNIDETKLIEIKDKKLLSRANNLIPEIFQAATTSKTAIKGSNQVLYQAILPAGAKLSQSQGKPGAFRGFFHGPDGIRGHAELEKVNNTANIAANTTAAAMGVASLIVGQYYMSQIDAELTSISEGISQIAGFQNNEYKSKVFALVTQVKKITNFQVDILENDEQRESELVNLNRWEHQCIELLGQANLTIADLAQKKDIDFDEYEEELIEVHTWYTYQKTLLEVLYKIADLKYILHLGTVSRSQSDALLAIYSKQVNDTISRLKEWQRFQIDKHDINISSKSRKRVGLDRFAHKVPSLIDKKHNYRPISDKTAEIIISQVNGDEIQSKNANIDLFQEDVKIIVKQGKIYYLPDNGKDKGRITAS